MPIFIIVTTTTATTLFTLITTMPPPRCATTGRGAACPSASRPSAQSCLTRRATAWWAEIILYQIDSFGHRPTCPPFYSTLSLLTPSLVVGGHQENPIKSKSVPVLIPRFNSISYAGGCAEAGPRDGREIRGQ